ncbi:hypothetical protein M758_1G242200 [Ceratodon purpureus]|nr:hypothetical protein M758_1G242200 [Ceratodon purpureus]
MISLSEAPTKQKKTTTTSHTQTQTQTPSLDVSTLREFLALGGALTDWVLEDWAGFGGFCINPGRRIGG